MYLLNKVTVRGRGGSIAWAGAPAAVIKTWTVARAADSSVWDLTAAVEKVDTFRLRQQPLLFEAPRTSRPRGLWCFPVVPGSLQVTPGWITARCSQPEGR